MFKIFLALGISFMSFVVQTDAAPKSEILLEHALLMSLSNEIGDALREKLQLEIVQYDCTKIKSIEFNTHSSGSRYLSDGYSFKLTLEMRAFVVDEWKLISLILENDNAQGVYNAEKIQIAAIPKNYVCGVRLHP